MPTPDFQDRRLDHKGRFAARSGVELVVSFLSLRILVVGAIWEEVGLIETCLTG